MLCKPQIFSLPNLLWYQELFTLQLVHCHLFFSYRICLSFLSKFTLFLSILKLIFQDFKHFIKLHLTFIASSWCFPQLNVLLHQDLILPQIQYWSKTSYLLPFQRRIQVNFINQNRYSRQDPFNPPLWWINYQFLLINDLTQQVCCSLPSFTLPSHQEVTCDLNTQSCDLKFLKFRWFDL